MWAKVRFIVRHLRSITIAGAVFWILIMLTLDLFGVISIEADCPRCGTLFERIIDKFIARAEAGQFSAAPGDDGVIKVRVVILPD